MIREYEERDLLALLRMHEAQGFTYEFPDLWDPLFLTKRVMEDDDDRPVMAALLRLTSEAYLLVDPAAGSPGKRWERLQELQADTARDARERGLKDVHAFVPPELVKGFEKRLRALGWVPERYVPFVRRTG